MVFGFHDNGNQFHLAAFGRSGHTAFGRIGPAGFDPVGAVIFAQQLIGGLRLIGSAGR